MVVQGRHSPFMKGKRCSEGKKGGMMRTVRQSYCEHRLGRFNFKLKVTKQLVTSYFW